MSIPLHRIVAATDLSAGSRHAVFRAARLGSAPITLVHAPRGGWTDLFRATEDRTTADSRLSALADDVAAEGLPRPVTRILEHRLPEGLPPADLLVMGAHGPDALRELTVGSTVARVLRQGSLPVLVVRRAPVTPYHRILVATDFGPLALRVLAWSRRLGPDAARSVVHACEAPYEGRLRHIGVSRETIADHAHTVRQAASLRMDALIAEAGEDRVSRVICQGPPAAGLLHQADARDADLIVIGRAPRSALEDFLPGGIATQILARATCDVLVIPSAS